MSELTIPEERLKMLKEKYPTLTDEQISEIAGSVSLIEPEYKEPESEEKVPDFLKKIGGGEMTMAEALVLMDFFDRRQAREDARRDEKIRREELSLERRRLEFEERKLEAAKPKQPEEAEATKHLKEMDEKIDSKFEKLESALTEKKVEDAEKRAAEAESKLKGVEDERKMEQKIEAQVNPLQQANKQLEESVKTLNERLQTLPKEEKETLLSSLEATVKAKIGEGISDYVMDKFSSKEKEPQITTKEGGQVDWGKELPKMIYKSIDTIGEFIKKIPPPGTLPPKKEVTPMEVPGGAPAPTPEQLAAIRRLKETIEKAEAASATPPPQTSTQADNPYFPPSTPPPETITEKPTTPPIEETGKIEPALKESQVVAPLEVSTKEVISTKTEGIPLVESAPVESKPESKPEETSSISKRAKKPTGKSPKEE